MAISTKEKIKTIIRLIREPKVFSALLSLRHSGFLKDVGWFDSYNQKKPVDRNNNPIPWFTYSSIDFLSNRIHIGLTVFEFGSGNSTVFFAERAKKVVAVEHDERWYNRLKKNPHSGIDLVLSNAGNVDLYLVPLREYEQNFEVVISLIPLKKQLPKFDIIVIDGLHRVECCKKALNHLNSSSVIILDDSERREYREGIDFLTRKGLKKIDFWGIPPGMLIRKCTSIFYKTNNCLDI